MVSRDHTVNIEPESIRSYQLSIKTWSQWRVGVFPWKLFDFTLAPVWAR